MSLFKVIKEFRKRLKKRLQYKIDADLTNNNITVPHGGVVRMKIHGKNNTVIFPKQLTDGSYIKLYIFGDNNTVRVTSQRNMRLHIRIGDEVDCCNNSSLVIGENTEIGGAEIYMYDDNSQITIGKGCLFSWDIVVWCTDTHTVTDLSGRPTNKGKTVRIGDHVWVGRNVYISKNTEIPANSIIGWRSNVTSCFNEENVVIAGNPAKVVKRGVNWNEKRYNCAMREYNALNRVEQSVCQK